MGRPSTQHRGHLAGRAAVTVTKTAISNSVMVAIPPRSGGCSCHQRSIQRLQYPAADGAR
jgi:hypothetical protein